jgi:hypothetical protein
MTDTFEAAGFTAAPLQEWKTSIHAVLLCVYPLYVHHNPVRAEDVTHRRL